MTYANSPRSMIQHWADVDLIIWWPWPNFGSLPISDALKKIFTSIEKLLLETCRLSQACWLHSIIPLIIPYTVTHATSDVMREHAKSQYSRSHLIVTPWELQKRPHYTDILINRSNLHNLVPRTACQLTENRLKLYLSTRTRVYSQQNTILKLY